MLEHDKIEGNGCLELLDDLRIECTFTLHQHFDGALFLRCNCNDPAARFRLWASRGKPLGRLVGITMDGQIIRNAGPLRISEINTTDCTLRASSVIVGDETSTPTEQQFTLTNVCFPETASHDMPDHVRLTIPTDPEPVSIVLEPHDEYQERERFQRRHGLTVPTAILRVSSRASLSETSDLVGRLCTALSIVQGHKINWITHECRDQNQFSCYRNMADRVTKLPSWLALNRLSGNSLRLPLAAAQDCYTRVCQLEDQYSWNGPVLEVWLEARSNADYIQTRSLKLVTVIEALRTITLRSQPLQPRLEPSAWDAFLGYIIPVTRYYLTDHLKISQERVDAMTTPERWRPMNRPSFRSEINAAFKALGVRESRRNIELFVNSRNKLIHEGTFRCQSEPAIVAAESDAPQTPVDEHFFIASFVDRVIMQAVGLQTYLNTNPERPKPDET